MLDSTVEPWIANAPVTSANPMPVTLVAGGGSTGNPIAGDQALTVAAVAQALTVPSGAKTAMLTIETAPIRISLTTTPTASVGLLYTAGTVLEIDGAPSLAGLKMIAATGSSAVVNVAYFG